MPQAGPQYLLLKIHILPSLYTYIPFPVLGDGERRRKEEGKKERWKEFRKAFHFNDSITTVEKQMMSNKIRYVDIKKFPDILVLIVIIS